MLSILQEVEGASDLLSRGTQLSAEAVARLGRAGAVVDEGPPSRRQVAREWRAMLDSTITREAAHLFARPWVEGVVDVPDPLVVRGLHWLHGADLAYRSDPAVVHHGPPGTYVHTFARLSTALRAWLEECVEHDRDPDAWRARRQAEWAAAQADDEIRGIGSTERRIE